MVEVDVVATTFTSGLRGDGDYDLALELTREQAEELFTDLFIKLTDKSGRE